MTHDHDPIQKPSSVGDAAVPSMWDVMGFAWELGFLIAIPAFLFGFGGAYLDRYVGTSPLFLFLGLAFALCSSAYAVYKRVKTFIR